MVIQTFQELIHDSGSKNDVSRCIATVDAIMQSRIFALQAGIISKLQ
jgi:hypothetical protein